MLFVIITGLTLLFIITVSWYISQVIVTGICSALFSTLSGDAAGVMGLAQFASIIWGPILDILVIVWMIAAAQMRDVESEIYG